MKLVSKFFLSPIVLSDKFAIINRDISIFIENDNVLEDLCYN